MKTFYRNKVVDLFNYRETPDTQLDRARSNKEAILATQKIDTDQETAAIAEYVASVKTDVAQYYPELMTWTEKVEALLLAATDNEEKAMWMISLRQAVYRAATLSVLAEE